MSDDIFYSQLIRPATMRSQYWKYFGFPADHEGNILSRKKIICTICNTSIAYNKNTTNLKAHLQARHDEELLTLDQTPSKKIKLIYKPDLNGLKLEKNFEGTGASPKYLYENSSKFEQTKFGGHMDFTNLPVDHETTEDGNDKTLIDNDTDQTITSEPPEYVMASTKGKDEQDLIYRSDSPIDDIISYSGNVFEDTEEALLQLFVESGMSPEIVEGIAFKKFCSTLNADFQVPSAASVSLLSLIMQ